MTVQDKPETRAATVAVQPPMAMLAELTYRCPLSCPYCSNPVEMTRREQELDTGTWVQVMREAAALGVLQVHLSGGEPASRRDLVEIVAAAREADIYTNLITSGIGLTEKRLDALQAAGLEHVQLSLQGVDAAMADTIGGYRGGFDRKMQVAEWVRARDFPLTLNAVMHKRNLDRLEETISSPSTWAHGGSRWRPCSSTAGPRRTAPPSCPRASRPGRPRPSCARRASG